MTDRPYTDADLRYEAAHQHKALTEDPDFMGIGEVMCGRYVHYEVVDPEHGDLMPPPGTPRWDELSEDDFDAAHRAIDNLLSKAPNVSDWAINLGADGLQPSDEHSITLDAAEKPIARIHFAFEPGMPDDMRTALVEGIGAEIQKYL